MYTTPDEAFARLHAAGWSVGETGGAGSWLVCGTNGENQIVALGGPRRRRGTGACLQAVAVGMLAKAKASGSSSATPR
jgi:hypothetical protein